MQKERINANLCDNHSEWGTCILYIDNNVSGGDGFVQKKVSVYWIKLKGWMESQRCSSMGVICKLLVVNMLNDYRWVRDDCL